MTKERQDELLEAMSRPGEVDLLYDLWTIAHKAPSHCASILVQYRDVARAIRTTVDELRTVRDELAKVAQSTPEIVALIDAVNAWKKTLASVDEDTMLNRINRLCDAAERVRKLKQTGELNTLRRLLEP